MTTFNTTQIASNNVHFDLLDYTDAMHMTYVAAEIASSTAWRIDTILVGSGRQLLKYVKEELFNRGGYDAMNDVLAALADAEFAELNFMEIGSSNVGALETIRSLNAQRDQWHDLAERLVSMTSDYRGSPVVYVTPTIESAFHKDPALRVNETTQRRLKSRSERMAQALGAPDLAEEHFKRSLQRKEDENRRVAGYLKEQAGLAHFMFQLALRTDESSAALRPKTFYSLPIEVQRLLLDNASNAALRADERAADNRQLSETEYDMISLTAIKAMTDLKKIASSPRFTNRAVEPAQV